MKYFYDRCGRLVVDSGLGQVFANSYTAVNMFGASTGRNTLPEKPTTSPTECSQYSGCYNANGRCVCIDNRNGNRVDGPPSCCKGVSFGVSYAPIQLPQTQGMNVSNLSPVQGALAPFPRRPMVLMAKYVWDSTCRSGGGTVATYHEFNPDGSVKTTQFCNGGDFTGIPVKTKPGT